MSMPSKDFHVTGFSVPYAKSRLSGFTSVIVVARPLELDVLPPDERDGVKRDEALKIIAVRQARLLFAHFQTGSARFVAGFGRV
jgi:hypothetical protein